MSKCPECSAELRQLVRLTVDQPAGMVYDKAAVRLAATRLVAGAVTAVYCPQCGWRMDMPERGRLT